MKLRMYHKSPAPRHIFLLKEALQNGGLIIIPTDSVYAIACSSDQPKAIERIKELKKNSDNANLSLLFSSLSMVSEYAKPISNEHYKIMNRVLPGPFTFILQSNGKVSKIFPSRKSIGVRIPDHNVPFYIIRELGIPLVSTSLHDDDRLLEYTTDPDLIFSNWEGKVDIIVDGGFGNNEPTTILDCTDQGITMLRQGIGELEDEIA